MPSQIKFGVFVTVILLCCYSSSFSQNTTPVTNYDCDNRVNQNDDPCAGADASCTFPPNVEKGCRCFDGINNDGDVDSHGVPMTDARDPDCASYYGLSFVGSGSNCSITPPGALTPFGGMSPPSTSSQNTSDTQSKVAAGDVDGNGTPDVVITAKFNGEVRVIATKNPTQAGLAKFGGGSFAAGTLIADFKAKNLSLANCDGGFIGKVRIEHEVLIADIDRDGDAEIFTIVSVRDNPPISVPNAFYLLALTMNQYGADGLATLYQPVCLGKNRPGIFGIADMDGDGKAEIYIRDRIFAAETGKLLASEGAKTMISGGTSRWDVDVPAAPVAVNMDGSTDPKLELVVGAQIYKIPTLTNRNPAAPAALTLWKDMNTLAFNIDGVAGNDQYFVKLMNDPAEYGVDTHSAASVGDIDKDGQIDVVLTGAVNSSSGRTAIFYWNIGDNTVTGFCTPKSSEFVPAIPAAQSPDYANYLNGWIWGTGRVNIGDANGDGKLDFSFVAGSHLFCVTTTASNQIVSVWSASGTQVKAATVPSSGGNISVGYRIINDSRSGVTTNTIYDFNNDGVPEMVYRDSYYLTVISGATGLWIWDSPCLSHTYTEGPIIADVNGDGNTDISCACYTSDGGAGFTANGAGPIQEAALGQVRIWYSSGQWLPTRKVWNQPGYFVVNINDDLTLPFPQMDIATQFSNAPCPNNVPGPQTPYNVFLNQVPFLSASGCPVFPAPDLTFIGDDPNDPAYNPNDPNNFPTVFVESPICGNLDIKVGFNVTNSGDLPISTNIPIAFFKGSPYAAAPGTGTLLYSTTIPVNNLQVGDTLSVGDYKNALGQVRTGDLPFIQFNGPGTTFQMYVVLYNNGLTLPIDTTSAASGSECDITNNFWPITVTPSPFTVNIDSVDNVKCLPTSPDSGELISHISVGADTVIDLSPYTFQWYQSDKVTPIAGETHYNITGRAAGDYYLVITNTQKGCSSSPVLGQVVDGPLIIPGLSVTLISDQTNCEPPNGSLQADVTGGNAGFEFSWEDIGGPIGVTGPLLSGQKAGTYTVIVTQTASGCQTSADGVIGDLTQEPDVTATSVDVVNCLNPSSGSVSATAFFNGVAQDSAGYRFDWYFYDKLTNTPGSILPGSTGKPTVKGLPIGYYEVVITQLATGCREANTAPDTVEIEDKTLLPTAQIVELAPQTSCDPLLPNGRLQANALINGVVQPPGSFTFAWFEGQNTVTPHTGGTSGTNGQIAEHVKGGGLSYTVKITTANQCSVTKDMPVSELIRYPQVTLNTTPNSVCDTGIGLTGSVSVATLTFNGSAVSLPNPNYSLTWFNGSTTLPANQRVADANKSTINLLDSGFYTLVVRNTLLNCNSVANVEQVLSLKALPVITADADSSTNCRPLVSGNGKIKLTKIDGAAVNAATHDFQWHRGSTIAGPVLGAMDVAVVDTIQGKSPNNFFTVFVRNQTSGCENTKTVEVIDARVVPVITLAPLPNTVCDPTLILPAGANFTGSVTATVTNPSAGGTYTFTWDDLDPAAVNPTDTDNTINQRDSSTYQAIATHVQTGCVSSPVTADVTETTTPPVIDAIGIASTNCVLALANGQAVVTNVDLSGLPVGHPYTFEWHRGTDLTGPLRGNTAATLDTLQGKTGKFYTVQVINRTDGCANTKTVEVVDNHALPLVNLVFTPNTICDASLVLPAGTGTFTGTVTGTVTNAVVGDTYTYAWDDLDPAGVNPTDTDNTLTQRDSSTYQAIVTHVETGCVSNPVTADVPEITARPVIDAVGIASTNCVLALANGQAVVNDVDLTGLPAGNPYTFEWHLGIDLTGPLRGNTAATLDTLQGKNGKFYTVQVINRNDGCSDTETVEVKDNRVLPTVTLVSTPNTICDVANITPDGTVTGTITNAIVGDNYTFAWLDIFPEPGDPAIMDTDNVINQRDSSTYQAIVTHVETGCKSNPEQIDVDPNLFIPPLAVAITDQTSCDNLNPNGALAVTIDETSIGGGAAVNDPLRYNFDWRNNGNPQANPGAAAGTTSSITDLDGNLFYTINVERISTGCSNSETKFLPETIVYPVVVAAVSSDVSSCAAPNGAILADVGGVEVGYTFFWLNEKGLAQTTIAQDVVDDADATNTDNGDYLNLIPGNYTVVVRDDATSCLSQPLTKNVRDVTLQTVINITLGPVLPSACGAFDGQMSAAITGGSGGNIDFAWHFGGPINDSINFFNNPPQFTPPNDVPFATLVNQTMPGAASSLIGLESRLYTLIIHDDGNGCGNYQTVFLPFNQAHTVNTVLTPSTICPYNIGNGEIDITVGNIVPNTNDFQDYTYRLYKGENPDPLNEVGTVIGPGGAVTNPQVYAALAPGKYTVEVRQDLAAFGSNCAVFDVVEIESQALNPVISLVGTLKANTACNVVTAADGEVEISVDQDPNDLTTWADYDIDVAPAPLGWGGTITKTGPYPPTVLPENEIITGLSPDNVVPQYTITVTSSNGCSSQRLIAIPNQPAVSELVDGDVKIIDAFFCTPSGHVEVKSINVIGGGANPDFTNIGNYTFTWFDNVGLVPAAGIFQGVGNPGPAFGGERLDSTSYAAIVPGSYWVRAVKTGGTDGIGCTSAPFKTDIVDRSVNPTIALTPHSNTSCTALVFEGSISVKMKDNSLVPKPPGGYLYRYDWDEVTNPADIETTLGFPATGVTGNNGNGLNTPADRDSVTQLVDGVYKLTAYNQTTGCKVNGQTTVLKTTVPIIIAGTTSRNKLFCMPSGKAMVTNVKVGGVTEPNGNFDFTWREDLVTNGPLAVPLATGQLDSMSLPTITNNSLTYFVEVTKRAVAGAPGAGCKSAPARIDILDKSVNPTIALSPHSNTSCATLVFEGSVSVKMKDNSIVPKPPGGYLFRYDWDEVTNPVDIETAQGFPATGVTGNNGNGLNTPADRDSVTQLVDGVYKLTAYNQTTGCRVNGQTTVLKTTVPIIIAGVKSMDKLFCMPSGKAIVTDVKVGGNTEPNGNFDFTWREATLVSAPLGVAATTAQLDSISFPTITNNSLTYFVEVTKRAAAGPPGVGCKSAPARIDISDQSVNPTIALSPHSNTSCATMVFEGSVSVKMKDNSIVPKPAGGYLFRYDWDQVTNPVDIETALGFPATGVTGNNGNGLNTPADHDSVTSLNDGVYKLTAYNQTTGCKVNGQTTVLKTVVPIIIAGVSQIDKYYCVPSGQAIVKQVLVAGNVEPNTNFDFTWREDLVTNAPLAVAANVDKLDSVSYTTITNNSLTYFVEVTKRAAAGAPGVGCKSAPARIDIVDRHVNPIPQLTTFANSSCTGAFLNGAITILVRDTQGPGVGQLYNYENFTDGVLAPATFNNNNGNGLRDGIGPDNDSIPGLAQGTYTMIVRNQKTFCTTAASAVISYDPVASKPNIVSVVTNIPFDCLGNGGDATVTSITIGSGAPITGSPALDPPNFNYDWYTVQSDAFAVPPILPGNLPTNQRTVTMLKAGRYWVAVRDLTTDCKSNPTEVFIDSVNIVYPHLIIQQTSLQLSCDVTLGTASLKAFADGQDDTNPDYFFTWYNNLTAANPAYSNPLVSTDSIGDLLTGNYSVRVLQNSTGCESTNLFIIPPMDPQFLPNMALSGDEQSSCLINNGSVVVRILPFPVADNGLTYPFTPNFKVDLYNGDRLGSGLNQEPAPIPPDMANIPPLPISPPPGSFIADPLFIGKYTIRVRDNNTGCILVDTTSVKNDRRNPIPKVIVENPVTNCDTRFNGQMSATADGRPVGDYDFAWWSTPNPPPGGAILSTNDKLIGVDRGPYDVLITNKASGCDTIATGTVGFAPVFPPAPDIKVVQPQIMCWEKFYPADPTARPTGMLEASVGGEVLGYRFDWYTGQFDRNGVAALTPDTTGIFNQHLTGKFGNDPGVYTLSAVILTTGCYSVTTAVVPDERVIPTANIKTTPSYCPDVGPPGFTGNGTVLVEITNTGNVSLRSILWYDDKTNAALPVDGAQVFDLPPGFYRAEFMTNYFCEGSSVGEIRTEVKPYNLVSSNGDNENDAWVIDCISNFTVAGGAKNDNNVKIFNRYGVLVYEADGYNNNNVIFRGIGENGMYALGNDLPDGTYFYVIDKRDGSKPLTGFLELVR